MVSLTILHQLSHVIYGLLVSPGRITMLEISRWTETGGSYRTIQRLYHSSVRWLQVQWIFFTNRLQKPGHEYITAGDEVVFGKAGTATPFVSQCGFCWRNHQAANAAKGDVRFAMGRAPNR